MKGEIKTNSNPFADTPHLSITTRGSLRKRVLSPLVCSVLAALGIFGGISALFAGLICVVVHSVVAGDTIFDTVGTVLLVAAIPAILIGSVFLDEIKPGN